MTAHHQKINKLLCVGIVLQITDAASTAADIRDTLQSNALCSCFDRLNLSVFSTDVTSSTGPLTDVKIRA